MHSNFMTIKYALHAYWIGWKTRRLISLTKFQNMIREVKEIEEFNRQTSNGCIDNHVLRARENFVNALQNTVNSKDWYKVVKSDLSTDEKKERVKRMRERNQRLKESQLPLSNQPPLSATVKGIHPDQRPIKLAVNYDDLPLGKAMSANQSDNRPISSGVVKHVEPAIQTQGSGGMMMTFDFPQATKSKPKNQKKTFLKRGEGKLVKAKEINSINKKTEPNADISQNEEGGIETNSKQDKSDSSTSKRNFLRKGQNLVYNPMKSIKEAKKKKKEEEELKKQFQETHQSLLEELERRKATGEDIGNLEGYEDEDIETFMKNQNPDFVELSTLRKMSREDSSKAILEESKNKIISKTNTNRKGIEKKAAAPAVSNKFQDLKYLKAIPKRVDWWLAGKPKKGVQTPSNRQQEVELGFERETSKFAQTQKFPKRTKTTKRYDDTRNEPIQKDENSRGVGLKKSLETLPEINRMRTSHQSPNFDGHMSYDSYDIYPHDDIQSVSQKQVVQASVLSQDDEKLESLLERLEESRLPEKGFTVQERNMIMEDTQYLAMLSGSETLYNIFQLMYNAEEKLKNQEQVMQSQGAAISPTDHSQIKKNYDFEFERLLLMLKNQYSALFAKKRRMKQIEQHADNQEYDSDTDSDQEEDKAYPPQSQKSPGN